MKHGESKAFIVTVEKRGHDYMAYLDGDKSLWDAGITPAVAVSKAIVTHADYINRCDEDEA